MQCTRCVPFFVVPMLTLVSLLATAAAKAPVADDFSEKLVSFAQVLDEIHQARESGAWQQPDWKPQVTQNYFDYFLDEVKRATKREQLALPVTFDQVKPVLPDPAVPRHPAGLYVLEDGKFTLLRDSIVLADGCVEITMAENCIVIARGAVSISHSRKNIVLAGHYANVSHDRPDNLRPVPIVARPGAPPAVDPAQVAAGSVIFSGDVLDMSFAHGTICCGLKRLTITHADQGAVVLNSPQRELNRLSKHETIEAAQIPFAVPPTENVLERKLRITQVVPGDNGLVVVQGRGVEYVLRAGVGVIDERGQPLPGLEQWTLKHLGRDYALFANGTQYAGLRPMR